MGSCDFIEKESFAKVLKFVERNGFFERKEMLKTSSNIRDFGVEFIMEEGRFIFEQEADIRNGRKIINKRGSKREI